MTVIDDFAIDKITQIINEMYNNIHKLEDLSRSIFIELSKKPFANEY